MNYAALENALLLLLFLILAKVSGNAIFIEAVNIDKLLGAKLPSLL